MATFGETDLVIFELVETNVAYGIFGGTVVRNELAVEP